MVVIWQWCPWRWSQRQQLDLKVRFWSFLVMQIPLNFSFIFFNWQKSTPQRLRFVPNFHFRFLSNIRYRYSARLSTTLFRSDESVQLITKKSPKRLLIGSVRRHWKRLMKSREALCEQSTHSSWWIRIRVIAWNEQFVRTTAKVGELGINWFYAM